MASHSTPTSNRAFTVLWSGGALTELGMQIGTFVYPLLALALTGSTLAAALAQGAAMFGLSAALLPAGVLVDRYDLRRLMLTAAGAGAVLYASLAVAGLLHVLTLPHVIVVGLLTGVATGVYTPAHMSAIRAVVTTEQLPTALSQDQARHHVASLVGGPLGGVLYGLTRWLPFLANALMFAAAFLTLRRLGDRVQLPRADHHNSAIADLKEGFGHIARTPFLRLNLAWSASSNLVINGLIFISIMRMAQDGRHPAEIGLVETCAGIGGLTGAVIAPYLINRIPTGKLSVLVSWSWFPLLVPLVLWPAPLVVGAVLAVSLLLNPSSNAALMSYRMAITPVHLQGRVNSTCQFVSWSALPLAPLLGGLLLTEFGGTGAALGLMAGCLVPALLVTVPRTVRSVPRPSQWPRLEDEPQPIAAGSVADQA